MNIISDLNVDRVNQVINDINLLIAPEGSVLNDDSAFQLHEVSNFQQLTSLLGQHDQVPPIVIVRDLELLDLVVRYSNLVPCIPAALVGMTRGDYSPLFETTVYPLERISISTLEDTIKRSPELARDPKRKAVKTALDSASVVKRVDSKHDFGPNPTLSGNDDDDLQTD